mmetsp:Transcript_19645/g.42683  ORF Transcript_19645/g.42683 Transcript_19645/m.42683 type:complete len:224 (-) Transcript_19645:516-1187(-)
MIRILAILLAIRTKSLQHTIITSLIPINPTKLFILWIITVQWTVRRTRGGHARHTIIIIIIRSSSRIQYPIRNRSIVISLDNGINLTRIILSIHAHKASFTIGTLLRSPRPAPTRPGTPLRRLLKRGAAKVVTFETSRIGQIDFFRLQFVHVAQWIGDERIGQYEITTWQVDETHLAGRTDHIGTMPPNGLLAPLLTRVHGIAIIAPAKHFIRRIPVLGVQTQ